MPAPIPTDTVRPQSERKASPTARGPWRRSQSETTPTTTRNGVALNGRIPANPTARIAAATRSSRSRNRCSRRASRKPPGVTPMPEDPMGRAEYHTVGHRTNATGVRRCVSAMTPTAVQTAEDLLHFREPGKTAELVRGVLIVREPPRAGRRLRATRAARSKCCRAFAVRSATFSEPLAHPRKKQRPAWQLPLSRSRHRWFIGRLGDREPDPHPSGAMTRHGAEEEEGTGLPGHETDVGTLSGREPLFKAATRSVLERRKHWTRRERRRLRNHLHRVGQVRVLVLEMEDHGPALRYRQHQATAPVPVEVHAAIGVGEACDELEVDGLARRIRAEPGRVDLPAFGCLRARADRPEEEHPGQE